jgi:N-dimethylarginine dimethylaminohydrolase
MGASFLMSYPPASWSIRGGQNARSKVKPATNPRAAMKEWLRLCDAITRHGGRILIMPPVAEATPSLTGMMYTANAGALFKKGDRWVWLLSKMAVAHRQAETTRIKSFWADTGMPVIEAQHAWEGQAEVFPLPANRVVLSWGVRSARESLEDVRPHLLPNARVLEVQVREPYFHGDLCLNAMTTAAGHTFLLAFGGGLANHTLPDLRNFVGNYAEVLSVEEDDALGYACNSLCVGGTVLLPAGLSTGLRGILVRRGFNLEELEMPELLGKGGGGPRGLVNELRGFVLTPDAPDYVSQRDNLHELAERYPETASP